MRKKILLFFVAFLPAFFAVGQGHTVSGYVEDGQTGERLIGCIVKDANSDKYVTTTNSYGFFSLKTPEKKFTLQVMYVGYETFAKELTMNSDTSFTVTIEIKNQLKEVVVTSDRQNVQSTQMSKIDVPISKVEKLPVIFGEVDLLKTLQLMPGVQSGTEGANGIYVRGGGPDQNLMLLDGVPVYNASHLFGFFSVFNTDAIKNVSLFKGGFPARYGGRLSSVIDVSMKDGNMKKFSGAVSVGLISSKFTIEGPIKKDTTSFIISGRRTYIDALAAPFVAIFGKSHDQGQGYEYTDKYAGGYHFYDLNAKLNHRLNKNNRLFLSWYSGRDAARIKYSSEGKNDGYPNHDEMKAKLGWGNIISAARWNHTFKGNLFMNTTLTYSRFDFGINVKNKNSDENPETKYSDEIEAEYGSGIDDLALMVDFDYLPNVNHKIKFGVSGIYHKFRPGKVHFKTVMTDPPVKYDTTFGSQVLYAPEMAIYAEDDINVTKWFKLNAGARFSMLNVRDTFFKNIEPRVSTRFLVTKDLSFKMSYAQMQQYLHFLTNNTVGLPIDLWMPATDLIVPEKSWQAAAGFSWLIKNKFSLSVEGFYKEMKNLLEFKDGESIFSKPGQGGMGETWEEKVTQGSGYSYGAEIFLQKNYGKLTGWISYTYARSNRNFSEINFGKEYPYKYDRRHDISLVLLYDLNENVNFGMTWVYGSGMPITIQLAETMRPFSPSFYGYVDESGYERMFLDGNPYYNGRNNYRLPSYHRLDLSVNLSKQKKRGRRTWSFGIYNVYNHINPFYTKIINSFDTYDMDRTSRKSYLRIYSIFQIMPSVSYKFVW